MATGTATVTAAQLTDAWAVNRRETVRLRRQSSCPLRILSRFPGKPWSEPDGQDPMMIQEQAERPPAVTRCRSPDDERIKQAERVRAEMLRMTEPDRIGHPTAGGRQGPAAIVAQTSWGD